MEKAAKAAAPKAPRAARVEDTAATPTATALERVVRAALERVVRAAPRVVRVGVEDMAAILTAIVSEKVKIAITQVFVAMASSA